MTYPYDTALRDRMTVNLAGFTVDTIEDPALLHAAVCLVVVDSDVDAGASVLLTLRPEKIKRHSNQFALPGGLIDDGETEDQAALRELHEELGLDLDRAAIIGRLDDYPTRSGYRISPIVLWGGDIGDLVPDPNEVAGVFRIPIAELDSPDIPILNQMPGAEHPVLSAHIPTVGGRVYAPTAAILYQFREVAVRGTGTRVAHFDQPAFAWR